jgi:hypothetical protein
VQALQGATNDCGARAVKPITRLGDELGSFKIVGVAGGLPALLSICSSVRLSTRTSVWLSMTCNPKPFSCVSEAGHGRQGDARLSDRGASKWVAMRRVVPCRKLVATVVEAMTGPTPIPTLFPSLFPEFRNAYLYRAAGSKQQGHRLLSAGGIGQEGAAWFSAKLGWRR